MVSLCLRRISGDYLAVNGASEPCGTSLCGMHPGKLPGSRYCFVWVVISFVLDLTYAVSGMLIIAEQFLKVGEGVRNRN